jgi:hypothetical protein
VKEEHSKGIVPALVEPKEVDESVLHQLSLVSTYDRSSKRAVQPSPTLADQFGCLFRHVRLGLAGFDIGQDPFVPGLGDELKAENSTSA